MIPISARAYQLMEAEAVSLNLATVETLVSRLAGRLSFRTRNALASRHLDMDKGEV
jgi:hypothetical protein